MITLLNEDVSTLTIAALHQEVLAIDWERAHIRNFKYNVYETRLNHAYINLKNRLKLYKEWSEQHAKDKQSF